MARGRGSSGGSLLNNLSFGVFSVNTCESDDHDWYCQLSRIFSTILMLFAILIIIYYSFIFLKHTYFSKIKRK